MWLIWIQEVLAGDIHTSLRSTFVSKFQLVKSFDFDFRENNNYRVVIGRDLCTGMYIWSKILRYLTWKSREILKARESIISVMTTFKIELTLSSFVSVLVSKYPLLAV